MTYFEERCHPLPRLPFPMSGATTVAITNCHPGAPADHRPSATYAIPRDSAWEM